VSDKESFEMTRRMAREEGLLVGGSCGMAVVAALRVAAKGKPGDLVVVVLPDSGRGYISKVFNDEWLAKYGFLSVEGETTVGDVLKAKTSSASGLPDFIHTHPTETIRDAVDIMREYGVSQLPVVKAEPPVMAGEVVGSVHERTLMDALFEGRAALNDAVSSHMDAGLPFIGSGESVKDAVKALSTADAVIVTLDGKPVGVVTRQDVLQGLSD
jgi:cystathionine beta-synthase